MAIQLPESAREVVQRLKVDVRRELAKSDPFVVSHYIAAILTGLGNRLFEFFASLRDVEREGNPKEAKRNLELWASIWRVVRLPGSPASGSMWVEASAGGVGTDIPVNTRFLSSTGKVYVSTADRTLLASSSAVTSITATGGVATATRAGHGLASNAIGTITGASPAGFNVAGARLTVLDQDRFTYEVDAALSGSATGTINLATSGANVPLLAEDAGTETHLEPDALISPETTIGGVTWPAWVAAPGILDGVPRETDDALRARLLAVLGNPGTPFNRARLESIALAVPGVTRVFVQEATPAVGQVRMYFLRDLDSSIIPSAAEVDDVKARIIAVKPPQLSDSDISVLAPTPVATNFTFTALSPNTQSMRDAIEVQLGEFFARVPQIAVAIPQSSYEAAIHNTRDPATGASVASFTLSSPSGTLAAAAGEIRTLGTVTFS